MADKPAWFIEAINYGTVNGGAIPKWFHKEKHMSEADINNFMKGFNSSYKGGSGTTNTDNVTNTKVGAPSSDLISDVPDEFSGQWPSVSKGAAYRQSQVKRWSYYNDPIVDRPIRGNSRIWGDAAPEVRAYVRNALIEQGKARGYDVEKVALMLAMVHLESGFNPDAAAGTSSARGVGQFINKTGAAYGLDKSNQWDVDEQVRAFTEHFDDNVKRSGDNGLEGVYVLHYAGGFKGSHASTGWRLSRGKVMPLMRKYLKVLQSGGKKVDTPSVGPQ